MILWSVQTEDVYVELMKKGVLVADKDKSSYSEKIGGLSDSLFKRPYDYMVERMDERIKRPVDYDVVIPWWAYYTIDGNTGNMNTDYFSRINEWKTKFVLLELEVPDEDVVLSDLDTWHYVVEDMWFDSSFSEEEWSRNHKWYDGLSKEDKELVKVKSWDSIFDLTRVNSEFRRRGYDIQATFWLLRKEYVIRVEHFVGKVRL